MSERRPPFRYRLDALERLRRAQRDAARAEAARARQAVAACERQRDAVHAAMQSAAGSLPTRLPAGAPLPLDAHLRVHEYRAARRDELEALSERLATLSRAAAQARANLADRDAALRAIERHRRRQLDRFNVELDRIGHRVADELWGGRRRSGEC